MYLLVPHYGTQSSSHTQAAIFGSGSYDDLYRVYRLFRERPNINKHRYRGGLISPGTICHRFTSWAWACRRFRDYLRNNDLFNDEMPLPDKLEHEFLKREEKRASEKR